MIEAALKESMLEIFISLVITVCAGGSGSWSEMVKSQPGDQEAMEEFEIESCQITTNSIQPTYSPA